MPRSTQVERITVAQRLDSHSSSDEDDAAGIELTKPRTAGSSAARGGGSLLSLPADSSGGSSVLPLFLLSLSHFLRGQLILHPDGAFVRAWQWAMLGSAMWLLLSTPWFAALDPAEGWRLAGLDVTLLCLHAIDIVIHLRTGFRLHGGAIEFDSRTVARRYLRSTAAVLDLLALAPFEFLAFVLPSHPEGDARFTPAFWFAILKAKHLLRIHTVWSSARLERGFQSPRLRVLKLFFAWSLVAHICASMLIFVARNQPDGDTYSWITVASPATQDQANPSNGALYITALYVSFVIMTSVGYGDTSPVTPYEQLVHCIILLVSLSFYALIFSSIAGSIQAMQVQLRKFQARADSSAEYAAVNDLPRELRRKMDLYVRRDWDTNHGFLPEVFLRDLPTSVRSEVMLFIHSALVQRVPFFRTCSGAFLSSVILRMRPQVLLAGDYVFRSGDRDRSCFYISKGEVEILQSEAQGAAGGGWWHRAGRGGGHVRGASGSVFRGAILRRAGIAAGNHAHGFGARHAAHGAAATGRRGLLAAAARLSRRGELAERGSHCATASRPQTTTNQAGTAGACASRNIQQIAGRCSHRPAQAPCGRHGRQCGADADSIAHHHATDREAGRIRRGGAAVADHQ